jgi:urease accessory protein
MKTSVIRGFVSAGSASLVLVLSATAASAHPMPGVGDFYAGMLHPATTIEFLLPIIALSLLAGQQTSKSAIAMLGAFPVSLAIGAALGVLDHLPSLVEWINLASMAVLGLLVAIGRPLLPILSVGLVALLGLTIGLANGADIGGQISPYRFIPGLAFAGLLLVTYGVGCVRRLKAPWMRIGFRVVGSWIAAVGILLLALK